MKRKIWSALTAFAVVACLGFSVFAVAFAVSANDSKTVRLVSMDYIENSLLPLIEQKIEKGSVESIRDTITAINQTLDHLNSTAAVQTTDIAALTKEIESLKGKVDSLQQANPGSGADIGDQGALNALVALLISRIETLEAGMSQLNADVSGMKETVQSIVQRTDKLENTVAALTSYVSSEMNALNGKITVNSETLKTLSEKAATMETGFASVNSEYQALTKAYNAMLERYTDMESAESTDRAQLAQMKLQLESTAKTLSEMESDYGKMVDAYNEYAKTLASLKLSAENGSGAFTAIYLKQGEMLSCAGLPTDVVEFIVRRGTVAVVSSIPTQGLLDLTDGVELLNNKLVTECHYMMLVGGSGGCGIVSLVGDAWILVRGEYEIG